MIPGGLCLPPTGAMLPASTESAPAAASLEKALPPPVPPPLPTRGVGAHHSIGSPQVFAPATGSATDAAAPSRQSTLSRVEIMREAQREEDRRERARNPRLGQPAPAQFQHFGPATDSRLASAQPAPPQVTTKGNVQPLPAPVPLRDPTVVMPIGTAPCAVLPVELPFGFEFRDGEPYCLICSAYATEAHVRSDKHMQKLLWFRKQTNPDLELKRWVQQRCIKSISSSHPPASSSAVWDAPNGWVGTVMEYEPQIPDGDPLWYEWRPEYDMFWCKLCRKFADASHLDSAMHKNRSACPDTYLQMYGGQQQQFQQQQQQLQQQLEQQQQRPEPKPQPELQPKLAGGVGVLPPGWESAVDKDTERLFYFQRTAAGHPINSQWEPPVLLRRAGDAPWVAAPPSQVQSQSTLGAETGFKVHPAEERKAYYNSPETGELRWNLPESF